MEVLQVASELEAMRALYVERKPRRVLEIGCWDGGTLREWLTLSLPELVVAVDLNHRNREMYDRWRDLATDFHVYTGRSQDAPQVEAMRAHAPYDWVFIDGDHGDWGVTSDVNNTRDLVAPGGVMLLHDIEAPTNYEGYGCYPPLKMLERFAEEGFHTERFVDEKPEPWAHGVGVVYFP